MDAKMKHLEMIQAVVTRMASNSFFLKGWTVTLVAALFALAAKDTNRVYFAVAFFPTIVFWILDGYFLSQERQFRSLYDYVRTLPEMEINFSFDRKSFQEGKNSWPRAFLSRTLVIFYGAILVTVIVVTFIS
jgi:hypothetical protein